MNDYVLERLAEARMALGLTQAELANGAGVSLPTIQNMEAGRANPSLETLTRLGAVLGMAVSVGEVPVDWAKLTACGLPLSETGPRGGKLERAAKREALVRMLPLASREVHERPDQRKSEALQALVLALQAHFPAFYRKNFARSPLVRWVAERPPSGRLIKLKRQAAAALSEYL